MPTVAKLHFDNPINPSLQVGDYIYLSIPDLATGIIGDPLYVEKVLSIGSGNIIIDKDPISLPALGTGEKYFALFAKDIHANESSLKGYYADITFSNSSNKKTELFSVSSEVVLSSK